MSSILIIDDDKNRNNEINTRLSSEINSDFYSAHTLSEARRLLKKNHYTAIILDMALPLYEDSENIEHNAGILLLNEIQRGRYKTPNRIIGITAFKDNLREKEEKFSTLGFSLHYSPPGDMSWINKAITQIKYSINATNSIEKSRDLAVLTVHGINTFGDWQERLYKKISNRYPEKELSHLCFKFTRFDIAKFLVPAMRDSIVDKFLLDFKAWQENNNCKKIVCFSHSFGTYILMHSLEQLDKEHTENIELIVLSGSVLKRSHDFSKIRKNKNLRIVNDCAINDKTLLISKAIVMGTGMAGKVGFQGLSDDQMSNRFFSGGHSMFFDKEKNHMDKLWLPLLEENSKIEGIPFESKYPTSEIVLENIAKFSAKVKYLYYFSPFILIASFFLP